MKTNHNRGVKGKRATYNGGHIVNVECPLSDKSLGARVGHDFTNGNRGMAKAVRGAKKFVRSRFRFHEDAATKRAAAKYMTQQDDV